MLSTYLHRRTKLVFCLFVIIGLIFCWQQREAAADSTEQPIVVYIDLEQVEFDVPPLIKNGTTLVPFRPLFEAMGMKVTWDPVTKLVKGADDSFLITLKIGAYEATVNDETKTLLQPAEIIDNRTFVPLRFIGEATGAYVVWDPYNRDITMVTETFMEEHQLTREALDEAMEEYFAIRAEDTDEPDQQPNPNIPATPELLASLDGMYAGFRDDFGGFECGGMCWDIYTFLPDSKVVVGLPENGGPETIDCAVDECFDYTYNHGELRLDNGESFTIEQTGEGQFVINDVQLSAVKPVSDGYVLDNDYVYYGYNGLVGVNAAATSWIYNLTLNADGTFESENVSMGVFSANVDPTHGATGSGTMGTYHIEGNTITLSNDDGTEIKTLFFLHDDDPEDIQIGIKNFYVDHAD